MSMRRSAMGEGGPMARSTMPPRLCTWIIAAALSQIDDTPTPQARPETRLDPLQQTKRRQRSFSR